MNNRIDELTKRLFDGSTKAFEELKRLELIIMNVKIATARLGDIPDARALSKTGDIINSALIGLESTTKSVRDISKEIAKLNKEENND